MPNLYPTKKMVRNISLFLLCVILSPLPASADEKTISPIDIGSRKQIFFDDTLFESSRDLQRTMHSPYQDNIPLLTVDQPWELAVNAKLHSAYASVLHENGVTRLWYSLITNEPEFAHCICYAESKDGLHFEKPNLNIFELNGSKANNIIIPGTIGGTAVWIDPKAPPEHRYKTQARIYKPKPGFQMHSSPDGIHWTPFAQPDVNPNDTQNIIFWDETINRYVLYGRELVPYQSEPKKRFFRQVRRLESDNLLNWDSPAVVMQADDLDLSTFPSPTKQPPVDYYGAAVFRYPDPLGPYIMLAHPFWHWKNRSPIELRSPMAEISDKHRESLAPATIDVRLAFSRDGKNFQQIPSRPPFLSLGPEDSHFSRMIWAAPNPIVHGDELWFYYTGQNCDHEMFLDPKSNDYKSALARAVLRLDGFVSLDADSRSGEFTSRPVRFAGKFLFLNLDASAAGAARVELLDENNQPFPDFSLSDADPLFGNSTRMPVRWNNQSDLSALAGKTVKLHITLKNAKLYSLQFADK